MAATNYINFNSAGAPTGVGYTPDGTLPAGAVACTATQAGTWSLATLVSGAIVISTAPAQTLAQQARGLLTGALAVTSTGTPALNATYPISGPLWQDLKDEATFIASFGGFSTGTSTMSFVLASGTVTFTDPTQLQAVVKAIGMYLSTLKTVVATNTGTLPVATATIA